MGITIVGEAYEASKEKEVELAHRERAGFIIDLENSWIKPLSKRSIRRGKACVLLSYPKCLFGFAGVQFDKDGVPALSLEWINSAVDAARGPADHTDNITPMLRAEIHQTVNDAL